jgi:translation elongation factor EF-Ts
LTHIAEGDIENAIARLEEVGLRNAFYKKHKIAEERYYFTNDSRFASLQKQYAKYGQTMEIFMNKLSESRQGAAP